MTSYAQNNPKWYNYKYYSNYTLGKYGCFITSLAMLKDTEPDVVAEKLKNAGCFTGGGLLVSECAVATLDLEYTGKEQMWNGETCIAETNYYANKGYPQHFFVLLKSGEIIDPLIGEVTSNHYPIDNIVSYRMFKNNGGDMPNCFCDRNMVVSVLKNLLTYLYGDVLKYPIDDTRIKIIQKQAEKIADSNIDIAGFLKANQKEFWPPCKCPPMPASIDVYTPWELIGIALRRAIKG